MPRIAVAPTQNMPEDIRSGTPNDYLESLRLAGADVVVLDAATDDPDAIVATADGLMLLGGHDVDPALYGQPAHPTFEPAAPGRDAFELALARRAVASERPLLAICRGVQVLNVALGGTLVQDIPSQVTSPLVHSVREKPWGRLVHAVDITPDSLLAGLLGDLVAAGRCEVNSRHHQSVGTVGAALRVTATASDGVIEAVEHVDHPFCVGVQWHPENFWQTGRFQRLFDAFLAAASRARSTS
jgi:putative glutamine amidotransferase